MLAFHPGGILIVQCQMEVIYLGLLSLQSFLIHLVYIVGFNVFFFVCKSSGCDFFAAKFFVCVEVTCAQLLNFDYFQPQHSN